MPKYDIDEDELVPLGTGELARQRVRSYFQSLRDQLCRQEVTALTVVDTYVRERLCSIHQQQEDLSETLSQVASICVHCDRVSRLDDARVVLAAQEIRSMLNTVEGNQMQIGQIMNSQLDSSIPITFTKARKTTNTHDLSFKCLCF
jgi:ABC-type transporter Mla MlaB component